MPAPGEPLRVAFVGQGNYFRACSLEQGAGGIEPTFIDFRARSDPGPMLEAIAALEPHVVIVFRPEFVPHGAFAELAAVTVGYLTEVVPRPDDESHAHLERRLEVLESIDASQFDRILSFDPHTAATVAELAPVWRSLPLPVSDAFYSEPRTFEERPHRTPEAIFVGRSTPHREAFLMPVKHEFDVIHIAHGISDERLRRFLADCDVGINVHKVRRPNYENRVSLYLAAGLLVITQPLSPTFGLEAGRDYLEVSSPQELYETLARVRAEPDAFLDVRRSGRESAEAFRASTVYPRLVGELLADVAASGGRL